MGGGKLKFDKCISTPTFMPRLGKIARILGPRGLMPNPKLGSVTSNVAAAVQEAKRGRIDFKIDKTGIVHVGLGKVNFSYESLRDNVAAFVNALLLAKPAGLKKTSKYAGYVKSFTLSSSLKTRCMRSIILYGPTFDQALDRGMGGRMGQAEFVDIIRMARLTIVQPKAIGILFEVVDVDARL
ncbi:hypothetical protein ACLOJK_008772 [Asimina triloba]